MSSAESRDDVESNSVVLGLCAYIAILKGDKDAWDTLGRPVPYETPKTCLKPPSKVIDLSNKPKRKRRDASNGSKDAPPPKKQLYERRIFEQ